MTGKKIKIISQIVLWYETSVGIVYDNDDDDDDPGYNVYVL